MPWKKIMIAMPTGIVTRFGMVTGTIDHTTPLVQPDSAPAVPDNKVSIVEIARNTNIEKRAESCGQSHDIALAQLLEST